MAASSVTGVGQGHARNQKGSEHATLGVNKLVGPRVMAAGSQVFSGTTTVVEMPALAGDVGDYVVMLTGNHATIPHISTALGATTGGAWHFTATGADTSTLHWMVVKKGF